MTNSVFILLLFILNSGTDYLWRKEGSTLNSLTRPILCFLWLVCWKGVRKGGKQSLISFVVYLKWILYFLVQALAKLTWILYTYVAIHNTSFPLTKNCARIRIETEMTHAFNRNRKRMSVASSHCLSENRKSMHSLSYRSRRRGGFRVLVDLRAEVVVC